MPPIAAFAAGSSLPSAPRTSGRNALKPGPALLTSLANRNVPSQKRLRPIEVSGWPSTASSRPPLSAVWSTHLTTTITCPYGSA